MKEAITICDSLDETIKALKGREDYLRCGLGKTEDLREVLQLIAWLEALKKYQKKFDKYLRMIAALESLEYFGSEQDFEKYYKETCEDVERITSSLSYIKAANHYEKEYNGFVPEITKEEMEWLENNKELVMEMCRMRTAYILGGEIK